MAETKVKTISGARALIANPPAEARPTPCFWWTGADLDRERLDWQLHQLSEAGIGGTIVGYGHLPQGGLDHENPEPFSPHWWDFFRWFVGRSVELGMTANIQDYGVIGPVLCAAAARTAGLNPGTLVEASTIIIAPCSVDVSGEGDLISLLAIGEGGQPTIAISVDDVFEGALRWAKPGKWTISAIRRRQGMIGTERSGFDPMHPEAANAVIELFYQRFEEELGTAFGTGFKIFFQDELDFGITMPMWNDLVAARLGTEFDVEVMRHCLWHDLGSKTFRFRARYKEIVTSLLEQHYFRPIFEWVDARGCLLIMDQLSRGDLRLGHHHYSDFLETMRWYHGPGNDDPDLTGPRNRFAFTVSASIAQLDDRPMVPNEAFHSSGWGVTPADILRGLNEGFAAGANHVILHGLNFTTEGGWWEWASPDFHFRQPWWPHSKPLWEYIARASSMLRVGREETDVLVIDPTADLDVIGPESVATERVVAVVEQLLNAGIRPTLAPLSRIASASIHQGQLQIGHSFFSTVISPGAQYVSGPAENKLCELQAGGGRALAVNVRPESFDRADQETDWELVEESRLAGSVQLAGRRGVIVSDNPGIRIRRRVLDDGTIYFVTNHTGSTVTADFQLPDDTRELELWDLQTGLSRTLSVLERRVRFEMTPDYAVVLAGSRAALVIAKPGGNLPKLLTHDAPLAPVSAGPDDSPTLGLGTWTVEIHSTLDNRYLDFSDTPGPLGVQSVRIDALTRDGQPLESAIDHGVRMMALGPIGAHEAAYVESQIAGPTPDFEASVDLVDREVRWRPYAFSSATGLDRDPLLLDTLTGPHGLKSVPPEFIDPRALDSDPGVGSLYYFASCAATARGREMMRAGARAAYAVWVDGSPVISSPEVAAKTYRPWALRDMSVAPSEIEVATPNETTCVVMRVEVAAHQPTRAWIVLGGDGGAGAPRSRLRWWWGEAPSAPFILPGIGPNVTLKVTPPPGAFRLEVAGGGPVVAARLASVECQILVENRRDADGGNPVVVSTVILEPGEVWARSTLLLTVANPMNLGTTAGVLTRPLRWVTRAVDIAGLADWDEWGLSDFSGIVHYSSTVMCNVPTSARLAIGGLTGSARVSVNGNPVGTIYSAESFTPCELVAGTNTLEIECANTLTNYYRRWPSPYAYMQNPGGGFRSVRMEAVERTSKTSEKVVSETVEV